MIFSNLGQPYRVLRLVFVSVRLFPTPIAYRLRLKDRVISVAGCEPGKKKKKVGRHVWHMDQCKYAKVKIMRISAKRHRK